MPVDGVRRSLWRALAAFRVAGLVVALVLIVKWQSLYARPLVATLVGAAMVLITLAAVVLALSGRAHRVWLVGADVAVTAGLTALTRVAQKPDQYRGGMITLTTVWAAGPTIEAALVAGVAGGLLAGIVQYLTTAAVAGAADGRTLYSGVLLVLAGGVVGLVTRYAVRAEDELRVASAAQAAVAERERLARSIHDGVLQVLGLVHRTGQDAAEPWSTLATEAGAQEAALRALISSRPVAGPVAGDRDLRDALRVLGSATVTVAAPAEAVPLVSAVADELLAAVGAAVANVHQHAGPSARAWVVLERLDDAVTVTVRDDGVGMPAGRLDDAARDGRLGVARSIRGRVESVGGKCVITSDPGEGTSIEMVVPL